MKCFIAVYVYHFSLICPFPQNYSSIRKCENLFDTFFILLFSMLHTWYEYRMTSMRQFYDLSMFSGNFVPPFQLLSYNFPLFMILSYINFDSKSFFIVDLIWWRRGDGRWIVKYIEKTIVCLCIKDVVYCHVCNETYWFYLWKVCSFLRVLKKSSIKIFYASTKGSFLNDVLIKKIFFCMSLSRRLRPPSLSRGEGGVYEI